MALTVSDQELLISRLINQIFLYFIAICMYLALASEKEQGEILNSFSKSSKLVNPVLNCCVWFKLCSFQVLSKLNHTIIFSV